jgi:4'-phosphopantetheinyl transferase
VDSVYVWWARRQDSSPRLEGLLDEIEQGRLAAYRRDEDRQRFLVGCALVKSAAASLTGKDPADMTLDRACSQCGKPHGKPHLPGSDLELSVSHSGDKIAVAVMTGRSIGVDVEQVRDTQDRDSLQRYVMAENETGDFFTAWTRKEAVTKATGDGLRVSFKDVVLTGDSVDPPKVLTWPYPEPPQSVTLFDLEPGPGYVAALAVLGPCAGVITRDGTALLAENTRRL